MSRRKGAKGKAEADAQDNIASPNAVHDVERLKQLLEAEKDKGNIRDETIRLLKEDKAYLQGELVKKDDLILKLIPREKKDNPSTNSGNPSEKRKHGGVDKAPMKSAKLLESTEDDEAEEYSGSTLSDSSLDTHTSMKSPTSKPRKLTPSSSSSLSQPSVNDDLIGRTRARNTRSIIARYRLALDAFKKGGSKKAAYESIGADRNTIYRTAPVAELKLAAPDIFNSLGPWNDRREKLSSFVDRCRAAMTPEVKEQINKMKEEGELLPIASQM